MRSACPWPWKLHHSRLAQGGAVFGGGKGDGGRTTYQTSSVSIPPEVLARYNAVNARAEQAANQPFQQYTGQFVAPVNEVQQAAVGNIGDISQAYGPYYGGAAASTLAGAAAGTPYFGAAGQNIDMAQMAAQPYQGLATQYGLAGTQAVNAQPLQTGRYMSPYVQSVVQPTMQALYQQQQQQQSQLMGDQARRGAFGGDRGFIQQANLAQQQGLAAAQQQGNLLNQAYGQALAAAQQQQGVNLASQQANRAALQQFAPQALAIGQQAFQQPLAAAQAQQALGQGLIGAGTNVGQALAGYGQGLTQTGLAANQALLQAGTLGQQTQQALNTAQYNQFLQQQGYPFQVAQFLANIAMGTGALSGSTTNAATTQPGSFFSDERLKENMVEIGKTHDGQPIYKYNYKGDSPRNQQIGLSAQEVEKTHPDAVGLAGGYKTVDYDAATRDAEAHRASGGLVPQSEGGAVLPEHAYAGYADGGDVVEYLTRGRKAYPYGGSRRFDVSSIRGDVPMAAPGGLQLIRAPLLDVRPHEPEFNQMLASLGQAGQAARGLSDAYSTGREALFGGYEKNPASGQVEATKGILGKGGQPAASQGTLATGWVARQVKGEPSPPDLTGTGATYAHGGRAGLAYGGDPLAEMQAMYAAAPWNRPTAGVAEATKPAGGGSAHKLMTAQLPAIPSQSKSPGLLSQAAEVAGAAKNIRDVYNDITKPSEEKKPPTPTDTATERAQVEATGLGNTVEPPGYEAPTGLGVSSIEDLLSAIPEARGGRIHYDAGGALPYASSSPIVPTGVLSSGEEDAEKAERDAQRNKPAPAPGLGGGSTGGGGGGGSSALGDLAKVAQIAGTVAMFLKDGGRASFKSGGHERDSILDRAQRAIRHLESSGRYDIVGPATGKHRPYGAYQVMDFNIGPWTKEAVGRAMTPEEFLKSPEAQDAVFRHQFGKAMDTYGTPQDAASVWFSGRPVAQTSSKDKDVLGTTVPAYIERFNKAMDMPSEPQAERVAGLAPPVAEEDASWRNVSSLSAGLGLATGGRAGYQTAGTVTPDPSQSVTVRATPPVAADAASDPETERLNREAAERAKQTVAGLAGQQMPPAGGVVPAKTAAAPAAPTAAPAGADRDFGERAWDYLTSERRIIPLLTGLATMASSPSRYLGSAILQGLGGGAQQYYNMGLKSQEMAIRQQEANTHQAGQLAKALTTSADAAVMRAASGQDPTGALQQFQQTLQLWRRSLGIPNDPSAPQAQVIANGWKNGSLYDNLMPTANPYYWRWLSGLAVGMSPELGKMLIDNAHKAQHEIQQNGGAATPDSKFVTFDEMNASLRAVEAKKIASKTEAEKRAAAGVENAPENIAALRETVASFEKQIEEFVHSRTPVPPYLLDAYNNAKKKLTALYPNRADGGRTHKQFGGSEIGQDSEEPVVETEVAQAPPAAPAGAAPAPQEVTVKATPPAPSPVPAAPTPTPKPTQTLADFDNPDYWQKRIDEAAAQGYPGGSIKILADEKEKAIKRLEENKALTTEGGAYTVPGYAERTAQAEAAKIAAQKRVETNQALIDRVHKEAEDALNMRNQTAAMINLMFDPKTGEPLISSGPLSERVNAAAAAFEQLGFSPQFVQELLRTDPNNEQAMRKLSTSFGSELARQDLAGNKIYQQEFLRYMQSVPSPKILPEAFKFLANKIILPKADYQIGLYNHIQDMRAERDNVQGAIINYSKDNPWYRPMTERRTAAEVPPSGVAVNAATGTAVPPSVKKYHDAGKDVQFNAVTGVYKVEGVGSFDRNGKPIPSQKP